MPQSEPKKSISFDQPGSYRIRVQGLLDESWSDRLGGLRIKGSNLKDQESTVTELVGKVRDQAELAGVLNTLYELHMTLLSAEALDED
ncbi:hypothetical protein D1AOALGA4SA_12872 [Olavius algarvensis Delta 1 endosymbiont]|nr:hypothetical protein D1AOALGA4SA_12872 [Olavius algarvensis Delta 1 endosymbiont]